MAVNTYVKKISQIDKLTLQLKKLEKEQAKPKVGKSKRAKRTKTDNWEIREKFNKTDKWFFKKINRVELLGRLRNKKRKDN